VFAFLLLYLSKYSY